MRRLASVAAIELQIAEAEGILRSLLAVKHRGRFDGHRRQSLDDVISEVDFAISAESDGTIQLTADVLRQALAFLTDSQSWIELM